MENSRFKTAFTLAEVLIVLGILGVIAAMTIPTLVNKTQNHEYVVALKKFYSTQNNGWTHMLADEGVEKLDDTSAFQSMSNSSCNDYSLGGDYCTNFYNSLKKYFKFNLVKAPSYQTYYLNGSKNINETGSPVLAFADGSVMFSTTFFKATGVATPARSAAIAAVGGHLYERIAFFYIDINGFKGPNKFGRDIFTFELSNDGHLYPDNGKDYSLYIVGDLSSFWQNDPSRCGTSGSNDLSSVYGNGCAARIMEEGWEMNY